MNSIDKPWFAAKRYGFGAGIPRVWQGWVVLALFISAVAAILGYTHGRLRYWLLGVLCVAFFVLVAAKTEGGWRWRWRGKDGPDGS